MESANEYGLKTILKAGSNRSYDDLLSLVSMPSLERRCCMGSVHKLGTRLNVTLAPQHCKFPKNGFARATSRRVLPSYSAVWNMVCSFQDRSRPNASRILSNFSHFQKTLASQPWAREKSIILLASCQKSLRLRGSATSKSCSIFKLRSGFCHRHMIGRGVIDRWNLIKIS